MNPMQLSDLLLKLARDRMRVSAVSIDMALYVPEGKENLLSVAVTEIGTAAEIFGYRLVPIPPDESASVAPSATVSSPGEPPQVNPQPAAEPDPEVQG